MVKEFVNLWDERKDKLEEYLKTHKQGEYSSYKALFALVLSEVINQGNNIFDISDIHVIDDGGYQGTLLFIIPRNCLDPSISDYIQSSVGYGSCSCCDTLQRIQYDGWSSNYHDELPTESQVKDYMTLCLHMLQRCSWLVPREESD